MFHITKIVIILKSTFWLIGVNWFKFEASDSVKEFCQMPMIIKKNIKQLEK